MSPLSTSLLTAITLTAPFLPATLARGAQNCGTPNIPAKQQHLNASLELLIPDPFRTPTGLLSNGSSGWKWNIGTVSHNITHNAKTNTTTGLVSQSLWLETESQVDLTSPSLGYTGCGALLHGLTHTALTNGQSDPGTCQTLLSIPCALALQNASVSAAERASIVAAEPHKGGISATTVCAELNFPIPKECNPFFTKGAWIQTFAFASPQRDAICPGKPSASNFTHPLASWAPHNNKYTYTNGTMKKNAKPESAKELLAEMAAYNNLTTQITPLITTLFSNQTALKKDNSIFISQHLSCLRPANISRGSLEPAEIPDDHLANRNGKILSATTTFHAAATSSVTGTSTKTAPAKTGSATTTGAAETVGSATVLPIPSPSQPVQKGGASGLTLMMDWACVLGISFVFGKALLL